MRMIDRTTDNLASLIVIHVVHHIEYCIIDICKWMRCNVLTFNDDKTEFVILVRIINVRPKHVKIGPAFVKFIERVPFIWFSIKKGTLK